MTFISRFSDRAVALFQKDNRVKPIVLFTTTLRKNCRYLELIWFLLPRIRTEYRKILRTSLYSV